MVLPMKWIIPLLSLCLACSPSSPSDTPDTTATLWTEACPADTVEFRTVDVGEVSLNVACRGSGPTLVLLHGFPEFWYGWNAVMDQLASKYRLIVPDQRGYNLSDKPEALEDYEIPHLVTDIVGLIDAVSADPVTVVAHDWGGAVAWGLANQHADKVDKLIILNAPHPDVFARELANNPAQQQASFYVEIVTAPTAETVLSDNDYAFLTIALGGVVSDEDMALYKEAWGQPGALTGMVNWYRANFKESQLQIAESVTVDVPTLVLWGLADTALLPGNLEGLDEYVSDLTVHTFDGVSHWIAHEIPETVADAIDAFVEGTPWTPETTDPPDPPDPPPPAAWVIPEGLVAQAAPEGKGLPPVTGVKDTTDTAVSADTLVGQWSVLWFYPAASTFG
jgi:pimeloyl-ACP methyl ester carboxylesterase